MSTYTADDFTLLASLGAIIPTLEGYVERIQAIMPEATEVEVQSCYEQHLHEIAERVRSERAAFFGEFCLCPYYVEHLLDPLMTGIPSER